MTWEFMVINRKMWARSLEKPLAALRGTLYRLRKPNQKATCRSLSRELTLHLVAVDPMQDVLGNPESAANFLNAGRRDALEYPAAGTF
jgi:hypothetical protein